MILTGDFETHHRFDSPAVDVACLCAYTLSSAGDSCIIMNSALPFSFWHGTCRREG